MFKTIKKGLLMSAAIIQTGCFKEIEIDIPEIQPLPVASTIFQPDSTFKVGLGKTRKILSNDPITIIDDAYILLFQEDMAIDTLIFYNGSYISDIYPTIGLKYKITIDIEGFETLEAVDKIPEPPIFVSASFKDSLYTNSEGNVLSQAEITFTDNPNQENYYELILRLFYDEEEWVELFGSEVEYIGTVQAFFDSESNDLVIANEGQLGLIAFENPVFSDKLFNGQTYTMRVNYGPTWVNVGSSPDADLVVILRSVSKDYYTYKKSLTAHIETQFSDIWDGTVEPASMFTNIEGGYGIFAGFSQVTDTIAKE